MIITETTQTMRYAETHSVDLLDIEFQTLSWHCCPLTPLSHQQPLALRSP